MRFLNAFFQKQRNRFVTSKFSIVLYALLCEMLVVGYLIFIALLTLESLLPTFVTARLSLSIFFMILTLGSFIVATLGNMLQTSFASGLRFRHPLAIISILWSAGIIALSLTAFPLATIPIILIGFLSVGYLAIRIGNES